MGTFSFNGNKTITCGGGGAIVTNNEAIAKLAKHLTTQAKVPHAWEFKHDYIGYNYRMPNLNAAMACAQIEQLNSFVLKKRELAKHYETFFENNSQIRFIMEPLNSNSNYWLNSILLNSKIKRDLFLKITNENGVMTRPVWTLLNKLPMFIDCYNDGLEVSEFMEERLVNLPSSVSK
jgi:perosamine synthetase